MQEEAAQSSNDSGSEDLRRLWAEADEGASSRDGRQVFDRLIAALVEGEESGIAEGFDAEAFLAELHASRANRA